MKSFKNFMRSLGSDESAQGATEYILLLVVVVGIAVLFKPQIMSIVNDQLGKITSQLGQFNGQ